MSILRQGRGLAVVGIETAGTDDELCSMAWNLFTTVCHPVPQYRTGELICRVEVTGTASGADHYSSSDQSGAFHTDGTLLERPPDVVALLCLSSADVGGETVLLDGAELCRRLDAVDPEHLRTLAQRHHLDTMGQIPGVETRKRAIVSRRGDRISLCYLRRYVEQGHLKAGVVVPAELRRAMDLLDRSASDESHQIPILLRRGEVLLWDNHRFLHGRRAFEEMRSRRRLRRMYGMHHDAPP